MPLYEFYCEPCDGVFELLRSIRESSDPASCPVCSRDARRVMPTSFNAFTFRDGYPRRIPDKGTYWHLGKEVKNLVTGPVRPNEHPEINKPIPPPKPLKGDVADKREVARLQAEQKAAEERERQAAIQAYEKMQAEGKKTADAL
ncbi:MAG TPA: zinc ribbon domain-containing protein [Dehalococcoidia bacterium]|nr:zinc ribbon domain-containing protein [Dehalococcoidia bacterium]